MYKFGWLLVALGALLLLSKGGLGFLFFPLIFIWPLALGALLFALFARGQRRGYGWHGGRRSYYWRGRHGTYGAPGRRSCAPSAAQSPEHHDADRDRPAPPRANTGETTRL